MAITVQLGGTDDERIFLGTDLQKPWKVADYDTDPSGATAKDISAFALTFDIRKKRTSLDVDALVTKSIGSGVAISGVFNTVLATSTQLVTVTLTADDLTTDHFSTGGGTFYYALKRTDPGSEEILAEGPIIIQRATQV